MTNLPLVSRRATLYTLACTALTRALAADTLSTLHLGVMDGMLGLVSRPESLAAAAALGLTGVQVTIGQPQTTGSLLLSDPELQRRFIEAAKTTGVALPNTYLDILHKDCLKSDATKALRWIRDGVDVTRALGANVLMLVFFNRCAVEDEMEQKAIVAPLKEASRMAADAGIVLGFEATISAPACLRVIESVNSPALKIWYDIGNSTNMGHFNVPAEIRALGKERICGIHIKDKGYLDEGAVQVHAALEAIRDIGYTGFAMLETSAPTGDKISDLRKNLSILRRDLAAANMREA